MAFQVLRLVITAVFLSTLFVHSQAAEEANTSVSEIWSTTKETQATWVMYPNEFKDRVESERNAFIMDNDKRKVEMRVYQIFPEPEQLPDMPRQRVWPLLKGMIKRMGGILRPRASYYLESGEQFQCRAYNHTLGQVVPVETSHCQRHCTHGGRYCAPQIGSELRPGRHGRDVVHEVLRRLCLDQHVNGGNMFTAYLQEFEMQDCFGKATNADVKQCSVDAMATAGTNYENLKTCLDEAKMEEDIEHPVLDENLGNFHKLSWSYKKKHMPQIDVDDIPLMPNDYALNLRQWSSRQIFKRYCDAFPYCVDAKNRGKPLACQVCNGCNDVQTCLWTLQCDGKPMNVTDILASTSAAGNDEDASYTCGDHHDPTLTDITQQTNGTSNTYARVYISVGMFGTILLAIGLSLVYCFRRRQADMRKAELLKRSIPQEQLYSDHDDTDLGSYSDNPSVSSSPGIAFSKFGHSVRPPRRNRVSMDTNMAPRPSEDRDAIQQELDDIGITETEWV